MPRTIAIGDIHGCCTALDALLAAIGPSSNDTIVGMGDYVDRGMESARVIETLIDLVAKCNLIPLIGNHELMMFKGLQNRRDFDFWFQHGGNATLASYGGRIENIPQAHMTFLSHCIRFFESDTHFFVHANYHPDMPLTEQPDQLLFWEHIHDFPPPIHMSGKTAVVGHTPQGTGDVRNIGHINIIDTYCYGDGWLTALDVGNGHVWQANNQAEVRESTLPSQETSYENPTQSVED